MTTPLEERRRYERLLLELPLRFTRTNRLKVVDCLATNISGQGIYFISPEPILAGERLQIDLQLPSGTGPKQVRAHLRCKAKVVRVDSATHGQGFGVGCRIDHYAIRFGDSDFRDDPMF